MYWSPPRAPFWRKTTRVVPDSSTIVGDVTTGTIAAPLGSSIWMPPAVVTTFWPAMVTWENGPNDVVGTTNDAPAYGVIVIADALVDVVMPPPGAGVVPRFTVKSTVEFAGTVGRKVASTHLSGAVATDRSAPQRDNTLN